MAGITFENGTIEVDAALVASGLRLEPDALQRGLKEGSVTSLCERGIDEDEGRYRLTFYSPARRLRLIVDQTGTVLKQSSSAFRRRDGS